MTARPSRTVAAFRPVLAVRATFWLPESSAHFLELTSAVLSVICFFGRGGGNGGAAPECSAAAAAAAAVAAAAAALAAVLAGKSSWTGG